MTDASDGEPARCSICGRRFETTAEHDEHVLSVHQTGLSEFIHSHP